MAQLLVRNLPDDVVARLKARAANENKSVEQLLREVIEREVQPSKDQVLSALREIREASPPFDHDSTAWIREDRDTGHGRSEPHG
jgi:plasmid stability protein